MTAAYVITVMVGLMGWALALFMKAKCDHAQVERRIAAYALSKLYAGQHVGGCNNRYEGQHCHDGTPTADLCAPCFGRRVVVEGGGIFDRE